MTCDHKDSEITHKYDGLSLYRCRTCGLIFSDRYKQGFDPKTVYENYYRNELSARFGSGIECAIRAFRFFRALKIFTISPRAKKILDIGSGRGFMLYYLKKYYGYRKAVGTQISKNAFEFSRDKLGLEIYDKDLLELQLENSGFDIITVWHVLEHITNPKEYIKKAYELLSGKGKLVIEVPNFDSWTRRFTGKYWLGLDAEHHLTFFTPASLCGLLEKNGFKPKIVHTFSFEYSTFISAQSFVSMFTRSNHLFFQYLQTGNPDQLRLSHVLLFLVLTPFCFIINILLYFSRKGEVLLVVAEKD